MADRLSMSLDEIIASRPKQRPVPRKGGAGAGGGHAKKAFKSSQHNKTKFHHNNNNNNHNNNNNSNKFLQRSKVADDDMEGEEEEEEEEESPAVPLRPMKMVTVARPKIVTPSSSSSSSSSSTSTVFQRLGSASALVKFENLKSSVAQADVAELCGSVGPVRDVRLTRSEGVAIVTFERSADAEACVKQYNGLALDGQVMRVSLGVAPAQQQQQQAVTVFSRLQQPTGQALASAGASASLAQPSTASNIRQGLFGTALGKEKDEAHRGGRTVSLQQEQPHQQPRHQQHPRQKAGRGSDTKQRQQTKNRSQRREAPKEQDLDADLEDYMAQR